MTTPYASAVSAVPTISIDVPVRGQRVTVVGGTQCATTTTAALLDAGAIVTVIAETPGAYLSDVAARGLVTLWCRPFRASDAESAALLFALTGDSQCNKFIAEEARRCAVLCSVGHDPGRPGTSSTEETTLGRVILVGGGPGDPRLLTVAGRDAIIGADLIVTDRLAPVSALRELAPHAEILDVSKIPGGRRTEQSEINAVLVAGALAGKTVVRLKGGDGFVFGRGGEELDFCVIAGIPVEVIPGVSSAIAAPASALIPVTHRGLTQGFTVISGHVPPHHPECTIDYRALAHANTTLVLMMAVANLGPITDTLVEAGMDPETPAAIIADGSLSSQHEIRATVGTIAQMARDAAIGPPATTVIGAVAGFIPGQSALVEAQRSRV